MEKVAIVGGGISGIICADTLARNHAVTLLESGSWVGGHTNTVDVETEAGILPVDTGFIVYNEVTYPNFIRFLDRLAVETKPAPMSFSVSCEATGFEYGSRNLFSLVARRANLLDADFYRMVRDILRFNRASGSLSERELGMTLGECVASRNYSEAFLRYYIVPMAAAIWSAPDTRITDFPMRPFIEFLDNHGLLSVAGDIQWRTLSGGGRAYVDAFLRGFPGQVRTGARVTGVRRNASGVELQINGNETARFDRVVFACHSDQALAALGDAASDDEREILGALPYQENTAILHTDPSVLPRNEGAWSAWNYRIPRAGAERVAVTYYMNQLQSLPTREHVCVTLNQDDAIRPERILRRIEYAHPLYSPDSDHARRQWDRIAGVHRTHYCGAYWFNGFHEDGVRSALRVCEDLGGST